MQYSSVDPTSSSSLSYGSMNLGQQQPMRPATVASSSTTAANASTSQAAAASASVKKPKAARKKKESDKERKTRSRAACLPCKSTKQKCDGPSRIPCRRCQLYGLDCKFPSTAQVLLPPPGSIPPEASTSLDAPGGFVNSKLHEIAERLRSIEAALHIDDEPASNVTSPMHESDNTPSPRNEARSPSPLSSDDGETHNPIQIINQSLDAVVGRPLHLQSGLADDYGAPDVLRRNLLTPKECQELFDFFFLSVHPWCMMLSLDEDRDALGVRSRSPLLFHTILLLASSYSNPFPSHLHASLITFTNAIIAPQILNPQPHELTTDFLRAVDLLNLYKPTQFAARRAEGKDDAEAMRSSKVNGMASWMLQGILARTAERLDLASVTHRFMRAYNASKNPADIPPTVLRDLRLYYWLLSNDVHGNVQSGRRCNMEGTLALPTTRIFSSLQLQPYDVRLAASVEMFEVARPILRSHTYERTRRIARADLERYNSSMAQWEEFWVPVLLLQQGVDPLAMSVLCPFQWFITLTYNAAGYLSWQQNRMYQSDSGGETGAGGTTGVGGKNSGEGTNDVKPSRKMRQEARGLSPWEFEALGRCVKAAEGLIFTLCEESRVTSGWRSVNWQSVERSDGYAKLTLDRSVVELNAWGMDAITCIAYVFPLVFLTRLVHDGILTVDLDLIQTPATQPSWRITRKLPRLLELGASCLDAMALNPNHPARAQAQVIRTILDAGLRGVSPSPKLTRTSRPTVVSPPPMQLPPPPPMFQTSGTTNDGSTVPPSNGGGGQAWATAMNAQTAPTAFNYTGLPPSLQAPLHQQQPLQPRQQQQPLQSSSSRLSTPTAMDAQSLSAVLDGFDPSLFGEAIWEWGGNNINSVGGQNLNLSGGGGGTAGSTPDFDWNNAMRSPPI